MSDEQQSPPGIAQIAAGVLIAHIVFAVLALAALKACNDPDALRGRYEYNHESRQQRAN